MTGNGGYRRSLGALHRVPSRAGHRGDLRGGFSAQTHWGGSENIRSESTQPGQNVRAVNELDDRGSGTTHLGSEKRFPLLPYRPIHAYSLAYW
jgi:hypothetical protein